MQTTFSPSDLQRSVIAVPPLCRDADLKINPTENAKLMRHIEGGGVTTFLYGGNANFYNIALSEYAQVLDILEAAAGPSSLVIPSIGPYFGTAIDQAALLATRHFPTAMLLPTLAVSKPEGVREAVLRIVEKLGRPIVLYVKDEGYITVPVAKALVDAGALSWIKYAVVRPNPAEDPLLEALANEVPRELLVSGIGEQPSITHWSKFGVQAFTAGCVCVAPNRSQQMLEALQGGHFEVAEAIRQRFTALEDLRNAHGPIQVLHHAVELAGIAKTGPQMPLLSALPDTTLSAIATAATAALEWSQSDS
ncbi:MAG: dihydrodipicolinate synthase family protein [Roseimicrobium sp.]